MPKKLALVAVGVLLPIVLLTACSIEPPQGKGNEQHEVVAPTEAPFDESQEQIDGLPIGFPEVPTASEAYLRDSYTVIEDEAGNKNWAITIIADEEAFAGIPAVMEEAGYVQALEATESNADVLAFQGEEYQIVIVRTEYAGMTVYSYNINAKNKP